MSKHRPTLPAAIMSAVDRRLGLRDRLGARALARMGELNERFRVRAVASDGTDMRAGEVFIYDEIGMCGVTAQGFADALNGLGPVDRLTVRINSPGGDVFDGTAIYNTLARYPAFVDVQVDGLAASAASFIAMAGDRVTMHHGTQMMVHDASGVVIGNAADMREHADLLDRISDAIADIYAARTGGEVDEWRAVMRAEQWYSADEAVTVGLADEALRGRERREGPTAPDAGEGSPVAAPADGEATVARFARARQAWDRRPVPRDDEMMMDFDAIASVLKGVIK